MLSKLAIAALLAFVPMLAASEEVAPLSENCKRRVARTDSHSLHLKKQISGFNSLEELALVYIALDEAFKHRLVRGQNSKQDIDDFTQTMCYMQQRINMLAAR